MKLKKYYNISVLDTTEKLLSVETEWKNFEKRVNHKNITSSFDWLSTWWNVFKDKENNQFGYNKQLRVLLVTQESQLVAIAPFVKLYRKKYGIKVSFIEFLGQQWAATFLDLIGKEISYDVTKDILDWLYKYEKFDVLQLAYIPEFSHFFNIKDSNITTLSGCPSINLKNYMSYKCYRDAVYSKGLKKKFKSAKNKMEKAALSYKCEVHKITPFVFQEIVRLSKEKLRDKKWSIYLDESKSNFVKNISTRVPSDAILIKLNNDNVAYKLCFYFNNCKFSFDTSYNRDYRHLRLGSFATSENIKDAFDKGLDFHCQGPGINMHKRTFIKNIIKIYKYTKPGNTLLAKLFFYKIFRSNKKIESEFLQELILLSN